MTWRAPSINLYSAAPQRPPTGRPATSPTISIGARGRVDGASEARAGSGVAGAAVVRRRPGTSSAAEAAGGWGRVDGDSGAASVRRRPATAAGAAAEAAAARDTRQGGTAPRSSGGSNLQGTSRLPEKVRPSAPQRARGMVPWRPQATPATYGKLQGAVPGQPLASHGELRKWGLV